MDGFPSAPTLIVRLAVFSSHALLFGFVPIIVLVLRPALNASPVEPARRAIVARRAETFLLIALVAAVAGTAYALVSEVAEAADLLGEDVGREAVELVLQTQFGLWHLVRFPVCLALFALLAGKVRSWALDEGKGSAPARWWTLWLILATVLLGSISLAGHAAASHSSLAVPNDMVHLAAGATWLSGVVALTWLLPAAWGPADGPEQLGVLAPAVDRFSRVAFWSVMVIAATGVANALVHLERLGDLVSTDYGRTLTAKMCAFACIVALGAVNHFVMRGRLLAGLRAGEPVRAQMVLRRTVAVEVALAVIVLGATAVLVGFPPPD